MFPSSELSKHEIVSKQHTTFLNRARDNSKILAVTKAFFALKGRTDMGAFHSTKISGNSGLKSNGTESFRKFVSKISVHLSRLSFFLEIWKFRKFSVPFGISTRFESAPVPSVVKSYKMAASLSSRHYTGCKMICTSSSLFVIENENVRTRFPGKLWTGRSEFLVGQFARFAYSPARKDRKFFS